MKNSIKKNDLGVNVISVVIPRLNGKNAKLLVLDSKVYLTMREKTTKIKEGGLYAFYMDSNCHHELLDTGGGVLTKEEFDTYLKDEYNSTIQYAKNGNKLKQVK